MWLPRAKLDPESLFGCMAFKVALQFGTGATQFTVAEPASLVTYAVTGDSDGHVQAVEKMYFIKYW